ncbi:hypothetical protein BSKO_12746 [Bryopsis sp. KO-2023]|nr:hypothetical protein BSKO_12746 [Bryopsis sp. KO-2023]
MEGLEHENEIDGIGDAMDCLPEGSDFFNFLGEGDDAKLFATLGLDSTTFETGLPDLTNDTPMEDISMSEPFGLPADDAGVGMRDESMEAPVQIDAGCSTQNDGAASEVVLGIPYYVACQWRQAQQAHVQQQQAAAMLWWQAYLCGACGVAGATGAGGLGFSPQQLGWAMQPQLQAQPGFGSEGVFPQLAAAAAAATITPISAAGKAGGGNGTTTKRRRRQEGPGPAGPSGEAGNLLNSKKGRRPKQEERVCKNCGTRSTPFWRKNKQDGLPLCNACGLYLAKNDAPRPKVLWKSGADETTSLDTSPPISGSVSPSSPRLAHDMMGMSGVGVKPTIQSAPQLGVGPSTPIDASQTAH